MMKKLAQLALYGLVLWLMVFVTALVLGPLRQSQRPLFESLIAVVLVLVTTLVATHYLQRQRGNFLLEGLWLGLMGWGVNIALDLPMFSYGRMQMTLVDYFKDIGLTYLMIPVITCGLGYLLDAKTLAERTNAYDKTAAKEGTRAV